MCDILFYWRMYAANMMNVMCRVLLSSNFRSGSVGRKDSGSSRNMLLNWKSCKPKWSSFKVMGALGRVQIYFHKWLLTGTTYCRVW